MYKIKNTELDLESRIFHLHKIFYSADECKHSLGLSANIHPVAIIPIGYPADSKHNPTARKSIDEIVTIL